MAGNKHDDFLERLQATFRIEAQERLQILSTALIALENESDATLRQHQIESIFREIHSLKGAARAVDRNDIEELCQALEEVLSQLKNQSLACSPAIINVLLKAADLLERLLSDGAAISTTHEITAMRAQLDEAERASNVALNISADAPAFTPDANASKAPNNERPVVGKDPVAKDTVAKHAVEKHAVEKHAVAEHVVAERAVASERNAGGDTIRISTAKLDALLLKIESLLSVKLTSLQRIDDIAALNFDMAALQKSRGKVTEDLRVLQQSFTGGDDTALRRVLDGFSQHETLLKALDMKLAKLRKNSIQDNFSAGTMVDALLDDMKGISMSPIASAFDILPRLVRDLAQSSGKEIDLKLRGGSIEIDRRILDELRDPLLHLVRNAIDHGIEKPALRIQAGKLPRANLQVEATQAEGKIQLSISDDGAGIDRARVQSAASRLGKAAQENDDDAQIFALIFESGLSTSPMVTDISGRGLGLAIVREKIETLGGAIAVSSSTGSGTQFRLTLPLTLATYRGVHVLSGGRQFIFPLMHVECVTRFLPSDVSLVQDRDAVTWNDQAIALIRLADLLELPPHHVESTDTLSVVIGMLADKRIAFLVDEVVGEQEVLVKNLGQQLQRVRNIGAATVLGDGRVALILNVADLFKSASRGGMRALPVPAADVQPKSILVAEDSITSRMLLRGVLEAAGYRVTVAVDGEDAFAKLRNGIFDLLISDVDMPRLSGFDLAARVRADQQLQALPIVLVTSLASAVDRERGIDVGANAYIVKSNFEEGNLLAAIQRLI